MRPSFGVRRLVAALPFQHGIFVNRHGKTANIQFQVKSAEHTKVFRRAKFPEKESSDESQHSKGRLLRDQINRPQAHGGRKPAKNGSRPSFPKCRDIRYNGTRDFCEPV